MVDSMPVENDTRTRDSQDEIRRVQEQQLQQQAEEARERKAQEAASDPASRPNEVNPADDPNKVQTDDMNTRELQQQDLAAQDIQAQIQAQTVAQANQAREISGADKAADAVSTASKQQDRGEEWRSFAAKESSGKLPPSVEEQVAAQNRQNTNDEAQKQINMRDLLAQLQIKGGKIDA